MPVAETSGNDAIARLLDCCCRWRISLVPRFAKPRVIAGRLWGEH
jgi:hypothetical protein